MWLLMKQCPLKHKECPLKRQLVGRVVRSLEIQVAKATNRQKNGSAEESSARPRELRLSQWNVISTFALNPNTNNRAS